MGARGGKRTTAASAGGRHSHLVEDTIHAVVTLRTVSIWDTMHLRLESGVVFMDVVLAQSLGCWNHELDSHLGIFGGPDGTMVFLRRSLPRPAHAPPHFLVLPSHHIPYALGATSYESISQQCDVSAWRALRKMIRRQGAAGLVPATLVLDHFHILSIHLLLVVNHILELR